MIDVVYPIGTGSIWQNNELRFSLRSVEKHLKNYRNIFIVGRDPRFTQGITILQMEDASNYNASKNIYEKIMHACICEDLSDDFLFMNDDYFLLQDIDATKVPFYYKGTLEEYTKKCVPGNTYRDTLNNAVASLKRSKLPTKNFDVHAPMIYSKKFFTEILSHCNWKLPYGHAIKSTYCNTLSIPGTEMDDCKINYKLSWEDLNALVAPRPFFSIGDNGITFELKKLLNALYPLPCRYEKS
jgi:hypothetical protein